MPPAVRASPLSASRLTTFFCNKCKSKATQLRAVSNPQCEAADGQKVDVGRTVSIKEKEVDRGIGLGLSRQWKRFLCEV